MAAAFLDSDFINNQDSKVRFINFTEQGNIDVEALSQQMNIESLTSWHRKNIFEPPERVLVLKQKMICCISGHCFIQALRRS